MLVLISECLKCLWVTAGRSSWNPGSGAPNHLHVPALISVSDMGEAGAVLTELHFNDARLNQSTTPRKVALPS